MQLTQATFHVKDDLAKEVERRIPETGQSGGELSVTKTRLYKKNKRKKRTQIPRPKPHLWPNKRIAMKRIRGKII